MSAYWKSDHRPLLHPPLQNPGSPHLQDGIFIPARILEIHARPVRDFELFAVWDPPPRLKLFGTNLQILHFEDWTLARSLDVVSEQDVRFTRYIEGYHPCSEFFEFPHDSCS